MLRTCGASVGRSAATTTSTFPSCQPLAATRPATSRSNRIDEASRFVPVERLCLSPQCGFSSTHHGNALSQDDQWRKLERVVEVAREVWG